MMCLGSLLQKVLPGGSEGAGLRNCFLQEKALQS